MSKIYGLPVATPFNPNKMGAVKTVNGIAPDENGDVKIDIKYTEAEKAEISAYIASELAKRGQLKPEFANSVDECTDTTKLYVLPDGYIYAYMSKKQTIYHNANDGTGILNARPVIGDTYDKTQNHVGIFTTAPIAVDSSWPDCIMNLSGLASLPSVYYDPVWIYYYDTNGNSLGETSSYILGINASDSTLELPVSFDIAQGAKNGVKLWANAAYVRIAFGIANASITNSNLQSFVVNFERLNIIKTEENYDWYSTGHMFNTDDYGQAIEQNAANIEVLQTDVEALKEAVKTTPSQSGAVWYAVGDSITAGYGVGADKCWVNYVRQYNGYDAIRSKNLGVSGLGFAKIDPNYGKTARTVVNENDFSGADLVTIAIGINDWKEPFSIETVKSEMTYCFDKILTDNPYCKIIFIVPFNIRIKGSASTNWALGYSGSDVTGGTLQDFIDTQKSVCEQYGVQVIDMTNCSVINKKNIGTVLYDGIHPDADCHGVLGRELARRITFA